ncbi:hypothetical protein D3C78_1807060 [compost metagenome]
MRQIDIVADDRLAVGCVVVQREIAAGADADRQRAILDEFEVPGDLGNAFVVLLHT